MDLAAASGEELGAVSDIVTDGLTAFGLKAKDSSHFADVLAQTSSKANTDVRGLGEAFKYVAPVAGALGYTIEDTSIAIGLMSNAGIKGKKQVQRYEQCSPIFQVQLELWGMKWSA